MKIKICGLSRDQDIDYVNEARPDYCGFVFAASKRQVSPAQAASLKRRLAEGITAVGVFVNAPIGDIVALYRDSVIDIAQLHGDENETYIDGLKDASAKSGKNPIPIIKVIKSDNFSLFTAHSSLLINYYLLDSGSGSGETFDWTTLGSLTIDKPWFLAGGINLNNIEQAIAVNPFGIDVSSGAETDGIKDRAKILQLVTAIRKGKMV